MAFSLIPKEEKFFDLFEVQSERNCEAARMFKEVAAAWDLASPTIEKIREIEHEADITTHEIIDKLNRTFITPFDREDIHTLASKMDDIMDCIQGTVTRMQRYQLKKSTPELAELAGILEEAVRILKKAISGLRDIKSSRRTLDYCIDINSLENAGDQARDKAVSNLFSENANPLDVIKWKEIYEMAETAIDMCEDVANTIEGIVVKHG